MRLTYDQCEFVTNVGWIMDYDRLEKLGFTTCTYMGTFFPSDVPGLLDFCAKNPEYHIVSYLDGGIIVNRYDPKGEVFKLADGDKDPDYALSAMHVIRGVMSFLFGRNG